MIHPEIQDRSRIWNALLPGLIGGLAGIVVSKIWSYFDEQNARRRERRRFLAAQANDLMTEILRIFIAARNELGYLASELSQLDVQAGLLQGKSATLRNLTGENPYQEHLSQAEEKRVECIDAAYTNLKRLHADAELSVRLLLSLPLGINLSQLDILLAKLASPYDLNSQGVAQKAGQYDELYAEVIKTKAACLGHLLDTLLR